MDSAKGGLLILCALAVAALLLPIGIAINQTWSPRHTDIVVIGLVVVAALFAGILALLLGLVVYRFVVEPMLMRRNHLPLPPVGGAKEYWQIEDTRARAQIRQQQLETRNTPLLPMGTYSGVFTDITFGQAEDDRHE